MSIEHRLAADFARVIGEMRKAADESEQQNREVREVLGEA